jgi:riboflavin kinase/FMN adenylyltransferase
MEIVRFFRKVPEKLKGAALAIGNFDGVHRGHQKVLGEAIAIAKREGRRSGAVVFEPHPREFFAPETPFFRLTPLPVKLELLQALGLDQTFVVAFDSELASLSAEAFATEVVAKGLGASHVVVGHDFSYGKGRTGTTEELAVLGRGLGFGVDVVAPVGEAAYPSSAGSASISAKGVGKAAEQLGYWWRVRGQVGAGAGGAERGSASRPSTLRLARGGRAASYARRSRPAPSAAGYVGVDPPGAGDPFSKPICSTLPATSTGRRSMSSSSTFSVPMRRSPRLTRSPPKCAKTPIARAPCSQKSAEATPSSASLSPARSPSPRFDLSRIHLMDMKALAWAKGDC